MKSNNSKITPNGYNSYEVFNDGKTQINILTKQTWINRNFWKVFFVILILMTIWKIKKGEIDIKIHKSNNVEQKKNGF